MARLFIRWLVPFLAVLLAAHLFPDQIGVASYRDAALFGFVLAILNAVVRPVLSSSPCP